MGIMETLTYVLTFHHINLMEKVVVRGDVKYFLNIKEHQASFVLPLSIVSKKSSSVPSALVISDGINRVFV